jgi:NAD(P)-dependent dehydrogenase (short-subunit alcohol dehydrogenase family)
MTDAHHFTSKLADKKILIFGGSNGIGLAVTKACVEFGAQVTISSSRQARINSAIKEILTDYPSAKARVRGYPCDLSTPEVEANLVALFERVGTLDHIVYTAGDNLPMTPLEDVTLEKIHKAGQVRTFAALLAAKIGCKYLHNSNTSSITLSTGSIMERPMKGGWSMIALFGAGLAGMTRQLAFDIAPIRVNAVAPGETDTEIWNAMGPQQKADFVKAHEAKVPTGHFAKVEDVAEAYLYLLRDANATGSVVHSNSGNLIV